MKTILFLLLVLVATPSFACSCRFDERTLEERIDAAERVLRVRVVGADLVGETTDPNADAYDKFQSERIAYRLRIIETLKGGDAMPPKLLGQAGTGGGDCTIRLPVGTEIILFVGPGERDIPFNYCSQPFEPVDLFPEADLRVQAIRDFVRERAVIHDCENLPSLPPERQPECKQRRSAAFKQWRDAHERSEAD